MYSLGGVSLSIACAVTQDLLLYFMHLPKLYVFLFSGENEMKNKNKVEIFLYDTKKREGGQIYFATRGRKSANSKRIAMNFD